MILTYFGRKKKYDIYYIQNTIFKNITSSKSYFSQEGRTFSWYLKIAIRSTFEHYIYGLI